RRLPDQIQEFIDGKRDALPQVIETPMLREYSQKLVERLEQQVREVTTVNAELQEADRLKNQFLATFSHELRTPLTSILGYVELLERGTLGALTPMQREAISVISRNTNTLTTHVNNLLYLQEVRSSQLKRAPIAIHEMLQRLLTEIRPRAAEGGVELLAHIPAVTPYNGDSMVLEQSFRNVIDNAVKFTPDRGSVQVILNDDLARLIVQVKDTGIGIPANAVDKIFLPFYQVDNSLARPYPGVGIGLAIVKHAIEAHHGHVIVRSEPGVGSAFTIVLPRK
ncbi:MAG: HAMP domain-containing histidine kinase, partial [Blastochloris sp.]|nr:HAMP domain-containing histidine kinase [Blastochloris sp.]